MTGKVVFRVLINDGLHFQFRRKTLVRRPCDRAAGNGHCRGDRSVCRELIQADAQISKPLRTARYAQGSLFPGGAVLFTNSLSSWLKRGASSQNGA